MTAARKLERPPPPAKMRGVTADNYHQLALTFMQATAEASGSKRLGVMLDAAKDRIEVNLWADYFRRKGIKVVQRKSVPWMVPTAFPSGFDAEEM